MCSQPEALLSLHRHALQMLGPTSLQDSLHVCSANSIFGGFSRKQEQSFSLSSCLGTYFLVWRLKLYLIPYSHREASRPVLRNKPASSTSLWRILWYSLYPPVFFSCSLSTMILFPLQAFSFWNTVFSKSVLVTLKRIITYSLIMNYS